jgi:signal peptidase II
LPENRRRLQGRLRDWVLLLVPALLLLALDQISKILVRQYLAVGEAWAPIPALSKVFTFTRVQNTGVAFGQMPGLGWLFMLVNLTVLIGILIYHSHLPAGHGLVRLAFSFVLAGDLGNVIDRLRTAFLATGPGVSLWKALPLASVTDFMDFKIWPVWNVADLCVVTGVSILAWTMWQAERQAAAQERAAEGAGPDAPGAGNPPGEKPVAGDGL